MSPFLVLLLEAMKTLDDIKDIKGQVALVRVDFNVGSVKDSLRLQRTLKTLKELQKREISTVIIAHRGRPHGQANPKLSLKNVLPFLKKNFDKKIQFFPEWDWRVMRSHIHLAKPGSSFMLENLRFHLGEEKNDASFAHQMASLGDFYVNDAFGNSHRAHASMDVIKNFIPSYAGRLLEQEIGELSRVIKHPKKPFVMILAGGKARDKFAVIEKLYPQVSTFLIGGILANSFLAASGKDINKEVLDLTLMPKIKKMLGKRKIILPKDFISNGRKNLDIGKETVKEFTKVIKKAKTIIWAGPVGFFEDPRYRNGSEAIARAIAQSKAYSIVGGGESTSLILSMGLEKKINFLSTGGGSMLAFLSGKDMPGLKHL